MTDVPHIPRTDNKQRARPGVAIISRLNGLFSVFAESGTSYRSGGYRLCGVTDVDGRPHTGSAMANRSGLCIKPNEDQYPGTNMCVATQGSASGSTN